jgi:hypothetical protein
VEYGQSLASLLESPLDGGALAAGGLAVSTSAPVQTTEVLISQVKQLPERVDGVWGLRGHSATGPNVNLERVLEMMEETNGATAGANVVVASKGVGVDAPGRGLDVKLGNGSEQPKASIQDVLAMVAKASKSMQAQKSPVMHVDLGELSKQLQPSVY